MALGPTFFNTGIHASSSAICISSTPANSIHNQNFVPLRLPFCFQPSAIPTMPLSKRLSSSQHFAADQSDQHLLSSSQANPDPLHYSIFDASKPKLLTSAQVPSWYAHNNYIRSGYRPVTRSVYLCLHSLGYLHNETVNIYSHLVPAIVALLGNYFVDHYFSTHFPLASFSDRLIFHLYLTTSVVCFGISSAYHSLLCHSERYSDLWGRLDYVAIVFQILGSLISGIYIGFYCEPHLQKIYWAMVSPNPHDKLLMPRALPSRLKDKAE